TRRRGAATGSAKQGPRGGVNEASSILEDRGCRRCRRGDRRARDCAIQSGIAVAPSHELAEITRRPVWCVGNVSKIRCRSERQQISNPVLRRRRNCAAIQRGRCGWQSDRGNVSYRCVLFLRQGPDLCTVVFGPIRPEFTSAKRLVL